MNRSFFSVLIPALLLLSVSCAGLKSQGEIRHDPAPEITAAGPKSQDEIPPEPEADKPKKPFLIMGKGLTNLENMEFFLLQNNPWADVDFVYALVQYYIEEAGFEGVNHDIAFSQMCLETGFLHYGGLVKPEWNNFCGLGAIGPEQPGLIFADPRSGVRAHIQHLKAYATEEPLKGELIDPRYRFVRKGSSPTIEGLSGTWATDRMYSVKIDDILQRLYDFSF